MVAVFRKWQSQYESYYQLLSWLQCDTDQENNGMVDCLWCKLCVKDEQNIPGSKNFSRAWISSSSNQKTSGMGEKQHISSG